MAQFRVRVESSIHVVLIGSIDAKHSSNLKVKKPQHCNKIIHTCTYRLLTLIVIWEGFKLTKNEAKDLLWNFEILLHN